MVQWLALPRSKEVAGSIPGLGHFSVEFARSPVSAWVLSAFSSLPPTVQKRA